jgi:hypothetical protein
VYNEKIYLYKKNFCFPLLWGYKWQFSSTMKAESPTSKGRHGAKEFPFSYTLASQRRDKENEAN